MRRRTYGHDLTIHAYRTRARRREERRRLIRAVLYATLAGAAWFAFYAAVTASC